MKVHVEFSVPAKKKFEPKLMKFDGDSNLVVLQTAISSSHSFFKGVVIVEGSSFPAGTYRDDWVACNFKPFTGTITLTQ